jgi:hypothetical protein
MPRPTPALRFFDHCCNPILARLATTVIKTGMHRKQCRQPAKPLTSVRAGASLVPEDVP